MQHDGPGQPPDGETAVVTGASSGIGRAVAIRLAQQGCRVGLISRRADKLQQVADDIHRSGGTASVGAADVGDRAQVLEAFRQISGELGPIDLLVANAGIGKPDRLDPLSVGDIKEMVRVNYLGVVYSIEAVLPDMLARGRGHLAAVSSMGAYKGMPGSAGYCAGKAAVNTFLEGLRIQLRGTGIAVTTICPGFVATPLTAENPFNMPGLLEPAEAARKIVSALQRKRKVYNFPWQMTLLMRLARWAPDWLIARLPRKESVSRIA